MQREVTRTTLAVLSIGVLIAASFWIIRPFLVALVWATMIVVATWPLMLKLQRRLRGRRSLAIALLTVAMLLVFVLPIWVAISTLAEYSDQVGTWTKSLKDVAIPLPPDFVEKIPMVGSKIASTWRDIAGEGWAALIARLQPYIVQLLHWLAAEAGSVGMLVIQVLATIVITVVLFANGEAFADGVRRFGRRLAGERGEESIQLAGQAIRGVALGVVVTALVQSLLGGAGLAAAGVPFASLLTVAMMMFCLAQIGPLIVLVPAVIWTFWIGDNVWGSLLLVWSVFVGTLDNFLRPYLIKKGADLPLLLIFAGVIGGLVSFGLLGIFVGPVVLAVMFKLLQAWVNETEQPTAAPRAAGGDGSKRNAGERNPSRQALRATASRVDKARGVPVECQVQVPNATSRIRAARTPRRGLPAMSIHPASRLARAWLPLVASCAALVLVAGCGREAPKAPEKGPVDVTVLKVQHADVPITAIYVAQTQSSQAVNIQARVSGWLDKRVYVEGSIVKAGQVLFQMDQKPFQAQVDAQTAAMQRNQAALQVATQNLARTKPLAAQNALSQKDLDDATGQYEQSAAAVEQAKAQLEEAKLNLSYTTIRSPVDGVSSYAVVADGTYLNATNSQLTTVSVLTPMWINFSISENEMQRIRNEIRSGQLKLPEGGKFIVEIEMVDGNLFPYTGAITFADPSYNPTTGTFLLRATVNNPAGVLRPNQYVRARLRGAIRPNAIVVPQRAVQQSAKGHFVWLVNKDNQAELRPVVVGEWKGDGWLIAEGLTDGDNVVVDGGIRLSQGAPVKSAAYVPPAPAAAAKGTAAGAPYPAAVPSSVAVYFAAGQAALDGNAQRTLRTAAAAYIGIGTQIAITGYADKTGNAAANVGLAKKRAQAVADGLVQLGVERRRIQLVPPVSVTGGDGNEQARRVDLRVNQ